MYNYVYFTRYPTELERAVEAHLQALKNTEDMTEGDAGIVSEEGSLWTMDLVSLALTGVKSQVHVTPPPPLQAHVTFPSWNFFGSPAVIKMIKEISKKNTATLSLYPF